MATFVRTITTEEEVQLKVFADSDDQVTADVRCAFSYQVRPRPILGSVYLALSERLVSSVVIPDADHLFTIGCVRDRLINELHQWMEDRFR